MRMCPLTMQHLQNCYVWPRKGSMCAAMVRAACCPATLLTAAGALRGIASTPGACLEGSPHQNWHTALTDVAMRSSRSCCRVCNMLGGAHSHASSCKMLPCGALTPLPDAMRGPCERVLPEPLPSWQMFLCTCLGHGEAEAAVKCLLEGASQLSQQAGACLCSGNWRACRHGQLFQNWCAVQLIGHARHDVHQKAL